jgi:hypothetical protein
MARKQRSCGSAASQTIRLANYLTRASEDPPRYITTSNHNKINAAIAALPNLTSALNFLATITPRP